LASSGGHALTAPPGESLVGFLQHLISAAQFKEAIEFLAFALPKREAVWWACLCARSQLEDHAARTDLAALEAAESWVYKPTEENRRAAMACAHATKFDTPSAWAAVGAFWSAGSIAPPDGAVVQPAPHLAGVAVAGAVALAAVQREPTMADQKRQRYIEMAIDIANGGNGRLDTRSKM